MSNEDIVNYNKGIAYQEGFDAYVCVEDHDDIAFWNDLLKSVNHDKTYYFDPYNSGKTYIFKNFADKTTAKFIICVDSDFNLFFTQSVYKNFFVNRPAFFYYTYTHSRENHLLHLDALKHLIQNKTNNVLNELKNIFESLSEIIYPIIIFHILFEKNLDFRAFLNNVDMGNCLSWDNLRPIVNLKEDLESIEKEEDLGKSNPFQKVKKRVDALIERINEATFNAFKEEYELLKFEINKHFKEEEGLYLIKGHIAEDVFLIPILNKIMDILIEKRKKEILSDSRIKDKQTRFNQLDKTKTGFETELKTNYRYCLTAPNKCSFMDKIVRDMKKDVGTTK